MVEWSFVLQLQICPILTRFFPGVGRGGEAGVGDCGGTCDGL